jgi:hypothetical protein
VREADHYFNLLSKAQLLAEQLQAIIAKLPPLKGILQGMRGSRSAGSGMDFFQFDEFNTDSHERSQINHRIGGARELELVRQTENESLVKWVLWRAGGPSMDFSSNEGPLQTKQEAADRLLLTAAWLLLRPTQQAQVTLLNGSGKSYSNRQQLDSLALDLQQSQQDDSRLGALDFNVKTLKTRSQAILVSDCVNPAVDSVALAAALKAEPDKAMHTDIWARHYIAPIVRDIEYMHAMDIKGHLVHVFDPLEWGFPFGKSGADGRIKFEFGQASYTVPRAGGVREDYLKRVQALQFALYQALEPYGWKYSIYVTDDRPGAGIGPLLGLPHELGAKFFDPQSQRDISMPEETKKAPSGSKGFLSRMRP